MKPMPDISSRERCSWAEIDPLMRRYHDSEWAIPQRDPRMLREMLMWEGFQAAAGEPMSKAEI